MKIYALPFYAKLGFILIILIAGGYIAVLGKEILVPLLFSFLFAILLLPLANFLENMIKLPRGVAAVVSVVLLFSSVALVVSLLGIQMAGLSTEWPLLKAQLENAYHNLQQWTEQKFHINVEKQTAYIRNATQNAFSSGATVLEKTAISLSTTLLLLVFMLLDLFFILFYRRHLMRFVVAAFTEKYTSIIYEILEQVKYIIRKYITGLFFEVVLVAAVSCIAFVILGIKYAFLLGLMVGLFNLIPYIGIYTALVLSAAITFTTSDAKHGLYVAITILCIHLLDSNFLMPKIVGSQVRINPFLVILGVVAGELLWGVAGMFLVIPYMAIAKVIFDRVEGLQPWGILLGGEEHPPKKVKAIIRKVKKEEQNRG